MKNIFVVLAVLVLAAGAQAQISPEPNTIGVYFDQEATNHCAAVAPIGLLTVYLVATNITEPSIAGWEARVFCSNPLWTYLMCTYAGSSPLNLLNPPDFLVGLGTPLPSAPAVLLVALTYFVNDDSNPTFFGIGPCSAPSTPACPGPLYASGADLAHLVRLLPLGDTPYWFGGAPAGTFAVAAANVSSGECPPTGGTFSSCVDWCNLQSPPVTTMATGAATGPIYGQVRIDGVTSAAGSTNGLVAQVGYGPEGSDPSVDSGSWQWVTAAFHADVGENDEYAASLTVATSGHYDYCYRYSLYEMPWRYGDLDGSDNGYSTGQAGDLWVCQQVPLAITATAGPNGAISPSGDVAVACGGSQEFTITPNACYHIADVLVDGASAGPVPSYTFNGVTSNHTIAASFASDPPVCYSLPDTVKFGTVEVGCYRDGTFSLENTGCGTLSGTVSASGGPFAILGDPSYALGPGEQETWTVRFEPASPGWYSESIDLGNGLCNNPVGCFGLAESSVAPVCDVSKNAIDFGSVWVETTWTKSFVISNEGGGMVTGDVRESCDQYSIVSGGGPFSLACNEQVLVQVEFAPTSLGTHTCTIETGGACADVLCTGTGVGGCAIFGVPLGGLDFGDVTLLASEDLDFVLKNTGEETLTGSVTESCSDFSIVSGGGDYSLGPQDSVVVTVRFTPLIENIRQCTIDTGCESDVRCYGVGVLPNHLYVDADATGLGTGASWQDAFPTLREALSATPPSGPVAVWVAEGTYKPTGGTARTATFDLRRGWSLLGGFAGGETSLDQRDPAAHPTILSGELGNPSSIYDNSYHVITASYRVDSTTVLDGFTVTRGNANSGGDLEGGGMIVDGGSPRIIDVVFADNQAGEMGGGLAVSALYDGNPTLIRVVFDGNRVWGAGKGGGMSILGYGRGARLHQVIFRNNTSSQDGGGLYCSASTLPLLDGALFVDNTAARYGGGMVSLAGSSAQLTNLAFVGNSSQSMGGGLYLSGSTATTLTNVSFSRNSAATTGGGIYFLSVGPHLVNAILWGNNAPSGSEIRLNGSTPSVISYSLIQGCGGSGGWNAAFGTDGGHNLDADPLFVDALADNLELSLGSPGIDAGNADAPGLPATDLLGNPRTSGATVDMGAYEFQTVAPALATVFPTPLVFDEAPVNQTICDTIYVANTGGAPMTIAGIYGCGAAPFALDTALTDHELEAGDTTKIVVCVTPTTEGSASCEVTIVSNATNSPAVVPVELQTVTGIGAEDVPALSRIVSISPNPFNPTTRIRYELDSRVPVSLSVFDVNGRLVKRLVDEVAGPGVFAAEWTGTNERGEHASTGVYFCRMVAGSLVEAKKMVLLK